MPTQLRSHHLTEKEVGEKKDRTQQNSFPVSRFSMNNNDVRYVDLSCVCLCPN